MRREASPLEKENLMTRLHEEAAENEVFHASDGSGTRKTDTRSGTSEKFVRHSDVRGMIDEALAGIEIQVNEIDVQTVVDFI